MALAKLRLRETLKNQSIRDALTGLFNRRYTDETFVREIHRAAREKSDVSLVSIDVDFFKKFNDVHGHQAGGRVPSWMIARLSAARRLSSARATASTAQATGMRIASSSPPIQEHRSGHAVDWCRILPSPRSRSRGHHARRRSRTLPRKTRGSETGVVVADPNAA